MRVFQDMDIEKSIEEFHKVLKLACNKSFRTQWVAKTAMTHKAVPWWTEELTIMRKRTNALQLRYQRTRNNKELREHRNRQYFEWKARYAATIKKEKNQFMEGALQHGDIHQSLECSIQI
jgi:hypothetical protein